MVDLLDKALVTRAEILDQRRAGRLQPAVHVGDAAREALAGFVERLRQPRPDGVDLLDEALVTRAEILDQRRARRLQPGVDVGDAGREALAHLARRLIEGMIEARAQLVDLLDETRVTRAESVDDGRARRAQTAVNVGEAAGEALRDERARPRRGYGAIGR